MSYPVATDDYVGRRRGGYGEFEATVEIGEYTLNSLQPHNELAADAKKDSRVKDVLQLFQRIINVKFAAVFKLRVHQALLRIEILNIVHLNKANFLARPDQEALLIGGLPDFM